MQRPPWHRQPERDGQDGPSSLLATLARPLPALVEGPWRPDPGGTRPAEIGTTAALVDRLACGPTVALGLAKWLLSTSPDTSLGEQLHNEAIGLELSSRSEDFREGLAAFKEKRPPEFKGR